MSAPARSKHHQWMLLALLAFATVYFCLLGLRPLMSPDEGRYAEISREMLVSGDWVTPRLDGYLYFEKPPLQYWATAAVFTVFGLHDWTARFWNALMYLAAGAAVAFCAARLYGVLAAEFAALAYFSMGLPFVLGQVNTLDPGVAAFSMIALCAFAVAQRAGAPPRESLLAMLICWAAMGCAVLSKGLIGIVLPGATLTIYILLTRQWRLLGRMRWAPGLILFAAIVVPWFVVVSRRNAGFAHFFFIHEHFERYLTTVHDRIEPWWYFIVVVVLGLLPWTSAAGRAIVPALHESGNAFRPRLFFAIWIAFVVVFFSLSQSKLIGYVMPVFAALALIIGQTVAAQPARGFRPVAVVAAIWWIACLIAGFVARNALLQRFTADEARWVEWGLFVAGLAGTVFVCLAWRLFAAQRQISGWRLLCGGQIAGTVLLLAAATPYANTRSSRPFIAAAPAAFASASEVYSIGELDQSLPFYLQRPVTLVDFINEFEYGMSAEPEKAALTLEAFGPRWLASSRPVAVISRDRIAAVEALKLPARIVFQNRHGAVMVRP